MKPMIKARCKFAERALVPANALTDNDTPAEWSMCQTEDGEVCLVRYLGAWNNERGVYDDELDRICQHFWGVPFSRVRSKMIARLGDVSDLWFLLEFRRN